jgi:hypothetical protein
MLGPLRPVVLRLVGGVLPCSVALLLGCGAADSSRAVQDEPPDAAQLDATVNTCPSFAYSMVLPQAIRAGETAFVVALATDPDSDDALLTYRWSASSGDFGHANDPLSEYTCADAGPQVLTVTTSDPDGCENNLDFDVVCAAP